MRVKAQCHGGGGEMFGVICLATKLGGRRLVIVSGYIVLTVGICSIEIIDTSSS